MALIDAVRSAVLRTTGGSVLGVFASSDQVSLEMGDLSNEVAADIAASHQWQGLTKIATFTGDGTQTAFPKPADYDRMLIASGIQDKVTWFWNYEHIPSVDEWIRRLDSGFTGARRMWILLGNQFQFNPAPPASQQATFPYISNLWATDSDGVLKSQFDADTDTFFLPDRLLTLGLIWRWKEQKGLEYAEDQVNFENALSQYQVRDGGPSVTVRRWRGRHFNTNVAYPWTLGPDA